MWVFLLVVALILWAVWQDSGKEHFWWYYPCMYNAEAKMVCNPFWYSPFTWQSPIRALRGNLSTDLRGDPYPPDGNIWGNDGLWRYRWY